MYERMSDDRMGGLPSYLSVHSYMIHLPLSLDTKVPHHHPLNGPTYISTNIQHNKTHISS